MIVRFLVFAGLFLMLVAVPVGWATTGAVLNVKTVLLLVGWIVFVGLAAGFFVAADGSGGEIADRDPDREWPWPDR